MTSPIEQIEIRCPKCGTDYKDWYRASINLMLDDFDEDYLRESSTATCPSCSLTVELGGLVVREDGVFEFRSTGPACPDCGGEALLIVYGPCQVQS